MPVLAESRVFSRRGPGCKEDHERLLNGSSLSNGTARAAGRGASSVEAKTEGGC